MFYNGFKDTDDKNFGVFKNRVIAISVYIDVLFGVNFLINYALICAAQYASKIRARKFGKVSAALLGALYACLMFFPDVAPLFSILGKISVSLLMVLISFKAKTLSVYARAILTFYLMSFVFGGVMLGVLYFASPNITGGTAYSNGIFYFNMPIGIFIFSTALSYAVISLVFKHYNANKNTKYSNVEIFLDGKTAVLKCLADSGNLLKDPLTGSPVIIAGYLSVKKILPDSVRIFFENCSLDNDKNISDFEKAALDGGIRLKIRAIPFSSIGRKNGILWGFKPDYAIIDGVKRENVVIGIYDGRLSEKNDYDAVARPGAY